MGNYKIDTTRKQILIIDDSEIMIRIYEMNFGNSSFLQNYQPILCKTPAEGFAYLEELNSMYRQTPSAILLDWVMPGKMDGLGFLKKLKSADPFSNIPVIMVSSVTEKSRIIEALNSGVDDYMVKPINVEALVQKLIGITTTIETKAV